MKYYNVVIDNKNKAVDRFFTYQSGDDLEIGQKVKVPFVGARPKAGFVVEKDVVPQIELSKIKGIAEVEAVCLNQEMVSTAIWMKSRYGIRYFDALSCFAPKGKTRIVEEEKNPLRDYYLDNHEPVSYPSLTEEQEKAIEEINGAIERNENQIYLLDGVTSSGKTLVYMEAAEKALSKGKSVIMLVPEIGLTGQTVKRFVARFGKDKVALLHSKLTTKERFDQWCKLREGPAKIVIGARIGVFAPLDNIGLVILDEEHESTYKSDQTPKYDTIDIAYKRLLYYNGVMVLGTATPSVTSYQRVREGLYHHIKLTHRYNNTPLPSIELVDMGKELMAGNKSMLSRTLRKRIDENLDENKQIILFLNRRGYSNYVSCRGCGMTLKCPECNITATYHKGKNQMVCHYCGKSFKVPTVCPQCQSKYIKHSGIGTEQVEEYMKEQYPDVSVARLDVDSGKTRKQIESILGDFKTGKTRILVGTQLVAKGLDFSNVGLVGIISADSALNLPDYRAGEKTFQLITQVAGRAGRGQERGSVIVQTYEPETYAIKCASEYDFEGFFEKEIDIRRKLMYPPFSDLVAVSFTHKLKNRATKDTEGFIKYIKGVENGAFANYVFSMKESMTFKGDGSFRFYTMVKCPKGQRNRLMFYIEQYKDKLQGMKDDCIVVIDVNPYGIL